jgi:hypothetical protein
LYQQLLVTVNADLHLLFLATLMMGATGSSETSVLTRAVQRYIPEDGILLSLLSINTHENPPEFSFHTVEAMTTLEICLEVDGKASTQHALYIK